MCKHMDILKPSNVHCSVLITKCICGTTKYYTFLCSICQWTASPTRGKIEHNTFVSPYMVLFCPVPQFNRSFIIQKLRIFTTDKILTLSKSCSIWKVFKMADTFIDGKSKSFGNYIIFIGIESDKWSVFILNRNHISLNIWNHWRETRLFWKMERRCRQTWSFKSNCTKHWATN